MRAWLRTTATNRRPDSSRRLLHRGRETRTKTSALFVAVDNLSKKLATRTARLYPAWPLKVAEVIGRMALAGGMT